ncbi:hypothetical protein HPB48_016975 [Haemaphysalis longicornis]|uniref:Uncharacterized protein n=1 Tax=Haemaphysalis longicornis TaxID=44386 RepID=A0A9J6GSG1_HAELO|nr:hypothetical protein HPB48_016975 [Haemaphysalis longicornis]
MRHTNDGTNKRTVPICSGPERILLETRGFPAALSSSKYKAGRTNERVSPERLREGRQPPPTSSPRRAPFSAFEINKVSAPVFVSQFRRQMPPRSKGGFLFFISLRTMLRYLVGTYLLSHPPGACWPAAGLARTSE